MHHGPGGVLRVPRGRRSARRLATRGRSAGACLQVVPFDLNTYIDGVTLSTLRRGPEAAPRRCPTAVMRSMPGPYATTQAAATRGASAAPGPPTRRPPGRSSSADRMRRAAACAPTTRRRACASRSLRSVAGRLHADQLSSPTSSAWSAASGARRGDERRGRGGNVETQLGYDYECARARANTYRMRSRQVLTADGTIASSPWTPSSIAGPNLIGTGWNLKAVNLPAASWLSAGILTEPAESRPDPGDDLLPAGPAVSGRGEGHSRRLGRLV